MEPVNGGEGPLSSLDQLADDLLDDLMRLSDAELLKEVEEQGGNPAEAADSTRATIQAAIVQTGKNRMRAARSAIEVARVTSEESRRVVRIQDRQSVLDRFANDDLGLKAKLTMAARQGGHATNDELDSTLADLRELGAIDEEGNPI